MSSGVKAIVIVTVLLGLLIVGFLAIAGAGAYWFSQNKDKLVEGAKKSVNEGTTVGKETDNQGCVDEALTRHKNDHGFTASIANGLFLQGCLQASRPTTGFCDAVPPVNEFTKSVQWRMQRCSDAGLSDQYCGNLFGQVQTFCESQRKRQRTQVTGDR